MCTGHYTLYYSILHYTLYIYLNHREEQTLKLSMHLSNSFMQLGLTWPLEEILCDRVKRGFNLKRYFYLIQLFMFCLSSENQQWGNEYISVLLTHWMLLLKTFLRDSQKSQNYSPGKASLQSLWGLTHFLLLSLFHTQPSFPFIPTQFSERGDCELPWQAGIGKKHSLLLNWWPNYALHQWPCCCGLDRVTAKVIIHI